MKHKSVLLFLVCLFFTANTFAGERVFIDSLWYELNTTNYTATVVRNYSDNSVCTKANVVIPATITYYGMDYAVKTIGAHAFEDCSNLISIDIPSNVTNIGWCAFSGCTGLTSISLPYYLKSINGSTFSGCTGLTSISIPNSVETIDWNAFSGCTSLTRVIIPRELKTIGNSAFSGCTNLKRVLNSRLNSNLTSIGSNAFNGCIKLNTVEFPESVTSIGSNAFKDCSDLTSIHIPQNVTTIADGTFYGCTSLSDLEIPQNVDSIADFAFDGCSGLNSIKVAEENKYYDSRNNCNALIKTATNKLIIGCKNSIIPYGVEEISRGAFFNCTGLPDSLNIPSSVKSIGDLCFWGCVNLKDIYIMNNIPPMLQTGSGYGSFDNTIRIHIPCNTFEIYRSKHYDYSLIEETWNLSVICQDEAIGTINYIQEYTCENGDVIFEAVATDKDWYFYQWNDGNQDNPRTAEITSDTTFTAIFAPYAGQCGDNLYWRYKDKTLSITGQGKMWDFANAEEQPWTLLRDSVYTLTFENGVTYVGDNAFRGLQRIAKVVFPAGLTGIGTSAFEQCIRLEDITFGADVADIGDRAFAGCSRVVDMTVYSTATPEITENTFDGVSSYAYLNVIENCMRKFQIHPYWSRFTLKAIGAETTDDDKFVVDPGTTDADFTWPQNDQAFTYSLEIKKDGEVFCTLTFNANGQLVGIAFAPGRDGNRPVPAATKVRGGYKFTVTGLSEGSYYRYTFETATEEGKVVDSYRGDFRTNGTTATGQIQTAILPAKTLRNGQVVIRKNGKTYDVLGKQIE